MGGEECPAEHSQIQGEIEWILSQRPLRPQAVVCYDRVAYSSADDPDLRLTFDENLRYRFENLELEKGDWGAPLLPQGTVLLEIKAAGAVPCWLARLLSAQGVYPRSFSKYSKVCEALLSEEEVSYAV